MVFSSPGHAHKIRIVPLMNWNIIHRNSIRKYRVSYETTFNRHTLASCHTCISYSNIYTRASNKMDRLRSLTQNIKYTRSSYNILLLLYSIYLC